MPCHDNEKKCHGQNYWLPSWRPFEPATSGLCNNSIIAVVARQIEVLLAIPTQNMKRFLWLGVGMKGHSMLLFEHNFARRGHFLVVHPGLLDENEFLSCQPLWPCCHFNGNLIISYAPKDTSPAMAMFLFSCTDAVHSRVPYINACDAPTRSSGGSLIITLYLTSQLTKWEFLW